MYGYKKGKKKERSKTSLNSLARNARTFRKLSLSVRCISVGFFIFYIILRIAYITGGIAFFYQFRLKLIGNLFIFGGH